jgi:MGT family glycosyltransferase
LRAERGLPPLEHLWDQVHRARRELVMTSRDFDFPARLPAGVRYVGPVLDDPAWAGRPWAPPAGDGPMVLVTMSSGFQDQLGSLRRIVEAMGTLPVRAVVTTGPAVDPSSFDPPGNVTVLGAAPHRQVVEDAALVVTHGGHGTVMKALAAGVPMVVLHHGRDQADNAARVTARGAGVAVKRIARPATIVRAAQRVLTDRTYRAAARRLGRAVRRDADSGALLHELEGLPAAGCPP